MLIHDITEAITDPEESIKLLEIGNKRYLRGDTINHDYARDRKLLTKEGQKPFATIVCCSDSRVSPDIFFDQELGDLFTIRNAGNIVDVTAMGSIEYAVEHLETTLVIVCGHSHCGAVTAACEGNAEDLPSSLKTIIDEISPSACHCNNDVSKAVEQNVKVMVEKVKENSIVKEFSPKVIGAFYDILTGEVSWL